MFGCWGLSVLPWSTVDCRGLPKSGHCKWAGESSCLETPTWGRAACQAGSQPGAWASSWRGCEGGRQGAGVPGGWLEPASRVLSVGGGGHRWWAELLLLLPLVAEAPPWSCGGGACQMEGQFIPPSGTHSAFRNSFWIILILSHVASRTLSVCCINSLIGQGIGLNFFNILTCM